MKYLSLFVAGMLAPAFFYAQTYITSRPEKHYNGSHYVSPVVTKVYPAYVPPRAPSTNRNQFAPSAQPAYKFNNSSAPTIDGGNYAAEQAEKRKEMGQPFLKTSYNLLYELNPVSHYRKFGYVNRAGQVMIPYKYDDALDFSEDRAVVTLNGKQTYIDTKGNELAFKYDQCLRFSEGLGAVSLDGKWGYVDMHGTVVIPLDFAAAKPFSEGLSCVKSGDKYGYINKRGATVIPFTFSSAHSFCEGMANVSVYVGDQLKTGFIDHSGTMVVPAIYDDADGFCSDRAAVKLNQQWGFVDKTGKEVIGRRYERVEYFFEGLAAVQKNKNGKWGFIDKNGTEVIGLQYDHARSFNEGLAAVKIGDLYGFINDKAEMVIQPGYYDVFIDFSNGIATVLNKYFLIHKIDKTGKKVLN